MRTRKRLYPTVNQLKFLIWVKLNHADGISLARRNILHNVIIGEGYMTYSTGTTLRQRVLNTIRDKYLDEYHLSLTSKVRNQII